MNEQQNQIKEEPVEKQNQETEHKSESVALDLNEFGNLEISSGGSKPTFDKITKASVVAAELKTTPEKKEDKTKDGQVQTYYPVYLSVTYSVEIDGQLKEIYENYSGGRLFVSESDNSKRFWLGEKSALGKLKKVLEKYLEFKGTLKEIPELMKNKTVGIKTETSTVAGTEYKKNMIEVFY